MIGLPAMGRVGPLLPAVGVALVLACTNFTVHMKPSGKRPVERGLYAGIGRADITPPAGYPLFGYSLTGKHRAYGVRTRLYARAFYLAGSNGEDVALVQCDLGAISVALHRRVAALVVESTGLGPDRILLAATHTHSAPGGYFGAAMYNKWGSREPGFDRGLFDFLSAGIAGAIKAAYVDRAPARAAVGVCNISGVTYNRSLAAHRANFGAGAVTEPAAPGEGVNTEFTMLRIDRIDGNGTRPLGAFTNFAIHGTSLGPENGLYSGDVHGAAERYLEAAIRGHNPGPESLDVLHAMTTGMAGDVGPAFVRHARGFAEANRLGRVIADSALALFDSLESHLDGSLEIGRMYREISLRRTIRSSSGAALKPPRMGFPMLGGTDDGYSPLHFLWPGKEGSRAKPADFALGPVGVSLIMGPLSWNGRDSAKISAAFALHGHALPKTDFPDLLTLQVVRLGDLLLAAVPAEVTTVMGERIADACSTAARADWKIRHVAIVSLANQYVSYITTPEEYNAQHYEGASTLWGPHTGEFVADELARLVSDMAAQVEPSVPDHWDFAPGLHAKYADFDFSEPAPVVVDSVFLDTLQGGRLEARCYWWDEPPKHCDLRRLDWRIEVPDGAGSWAPYATPGIDSLSSLFFDAAGLGLTIRRCDKDEMAAIESSPVHTDWAPPEGKKLWCVGWILPEGDGPTEFRFALYGETGEPVFASVGRSAK